MTMPSQIPILMTFNILFLAAVVTPRTFTSIAKMKTLPAIERSLISALQEYVQSTEPSLKHYTLKRFMHKCHRECILAENDEHYMENPINCFHVLRRLVQDWNDVIAIIRCDHCNTNHPTSAGSVRIRKRSFYWIDDRYVMYHHAVFWYKTQAVISTSFWPEKEDLDGSIIALARLVYTYDLDIADVCRGVLKDISTSPLTLRELVMIGDRCHEEDMHYDAVLFYNQALLKAMASHYDEDDGDLAELVTRKSESLSPFVIYRKISSSYYHFGAISLALRTIKKSLRLSLTQYEQDLLEVDRNYYEKLQAQSRVEETVFQRRYPNNTEVAWQSYMNLCKRPSKRAISQNLFCKYWDTTNPIFKIKAEFCHRNPDVIRFYDVIHEQEINVLKNRSFQKLHRSSGITKRTDIKMKERISESAWHDDTKLPELSKLNHRMHIITGLNVSVHQFDTPAEQLQVLNYGLGGMYEPHYDAYYDVTGGNRKGDSQFAKSGDRVATMVLYLSDVTHGGATVFPRLNLKLEPIKGSASFWWNLHRNGTTDKRSLHAGCPVLVGEKWRECRACLEIGAKY